MSTTVKAIQFAASTDEEAWHADRDEGVTASQVHRIATGGRKTWRGILAEKLNGSTFRGNRHTDRGHEREAVLLEYAGEFIGHHVVPNATLFGNLESPLHRATPDGISQFEGEGVGVEVKSHAYGWERRDIPRDHFDQMQWGMHVLGFDHWLYGWEVMGPDGNPDAEPTFRWVARNQARIDQLVKAANEFIAWREAGAPELDVVPEEVDEALAIITRTKEWKKALDEEEAPADKIVRAYIEATAPKGEGLKRSSISGGFSWSSTPKDVLDEAAWKEAEPESYAGWLELKSRVAEAEVAAIALYSKEKVSTRLAYTAPGEKAAA